MFKETNVLGHMYFTWNKVTTKMILYTSTLLISGTYHTSQTGAIVQSWFVFEASLNLL